MDDDLITACVTGNWYARTIAANSLKSFTGYTSDDVGPLDAPEWVASGRMAVCLDGSIIVHGVSRSAP